MNAEQKVKALILTRHAEWHEITLPELTAENVDEVYDEINGDDYALQDAVNETRHSGIDTGLPCRQYSRHYESDEVAAQALDGTWVGWTYWYGGGKYGEPEAIDWMGDAYDLNCVEEEKLVIVRTFSKVEGQA